MATKKIKPIFINLNAPPEEIKNMIKSKTFEPIEIDVIDYKKEFNIRSNNLYNELSSVADKLYERSILYINEKGNLVKKRWVITCEYNERDKSIKIQFHPDLIMDLLIFKNKFTILQYDVSKSIKNSYTYRLYELLKQYLKIGKRTFMIGELRYKLSIEDNEYPLYGNLKQKIIKPSIKTINKYTDIEVELLEVKNKKTRRVEKITFTIRLNKINSPKKVIDEKHSQIQFEEVAMDKDEFSAFQTLKEILKIDITPQTADEIFNDALKGIGDKGLNIGTFDYIRKQVEIVEIYMKYKKINEKDDFVKLLKSALRENWKKKNKGTYTKVDRFNDFEQRDYDFDELERKLLGWNKDEF